MGVTTFAIALFGDGVPVTRSSLSTRLTRAVDHRVITIVGLDLRRYPDGPWASVATSPFAGECAVRFISKVDASAAYGIVRSTRAVWHRTPPGRYWSSRSPARDHYKLTPSSFAISVLRSSTDFNRTVRASLLTGTWGGRETATPGMCSAAHRLKRGNLLGPLMGRVWVYLKVMTASF